MKTRDNLPLRQRKSHGLFDSSGRDALAPFLSDPTEPEPAGALRLSAGLAQRLDARALDARRFGDAACDALFEAVLIDDAVDAHTELPDRITLDHDRAQLIDCYRICRQMWRDAFDRGALIALLDRLKHDRDLGPEDRLRFKHTRARFKHLRFATALYGKAHRYPTVLDWMTTALGHLQDAFRTGLEAKVYREALLCRLFLTTGPQVLLLNEVDHLEPASSSGFRHYVARQVDSLEDVLARPMVTGAQFHATRKIASRQVSFYDTLRTIAPSDEAYRMSRALAAINGLMGDMHDRLIERRVAGLQDYHHTPFALPDEIRGRLDALIKRYRDSGLVRSARRD